MTASSCLAEAWQSDEGLNVAALLGNSPSTPEPEMPSPDRVSQSCLSGKGVPFGVVFALSTRLCRLPDLGVTLLPRKVETGEAYSSFAANPPAALLSLVLLATGVTTGAVVFVAIFGVSGVLFVPFAAKVGIWGGLADAPAFSTGIVAVGGAFTGRAFRSLGRRGVRSVDASVGGRRTVDAATAEAMMRGARLGVLGTIGRLGDGGFFWETLMLLPLSETTEDARRALLAELTVGARGEDRGVDVELGLRLRIVTPTPPSRYPDFCPRSSAPYWLAWPENDIDSATPNWRQGLTGNEP